MEKPMGEYRRVGKLKQWWLWLLYKLGLAPWSPACIWGLKSWGRCEKDADR
jgi:hypothetical protein